MTIIIIVIVILPPLLSVTINSTGNRGLAIIGLPVITPSALRNNPTGNGFGDVVDTLQVTGTFKPKFIR